MHIPDGFLDAKTALATTVLGATALAVALRETRLRLPPRRVPLLGLAAAFLFAAQMINFPVAAGTSGHLIGSVLTAVLLGPSAAIVVVTTVLFIQCLIFADGGFTALGANVLNMGVLGGVGGYAVYFAVSRLVRGLFGRLLAASFAAWCGTLLAALACAGELAVSGTVAWGRVLPAMLGVHALIGLGEGLVTALVLAGVARTRPELLRIDDGPVERATSYTTVAAYGATIALGLALFASPLASTWPDGLDRTAEALGFAGRAARPVVPAPLPDYRVPGLGWGPIGTSLAGAAGTTVVFALSWLLAGSLVAKERRGARATGG